MGEGIAHWQKCSDGPERLVRLRTSRGVQIPEHVEVGAAVHAAFEELQLVDLALGLAVAPSQREACSDRCAIIRQTAGEPVQLGNLAGALSLATSG